MVNGSNNGGDKCWAVISTHPHKEHVAVKNLRRQAFQTYCPKLRRSIRKARRFHYVERPLFPGYVFVRFAPQRDQWRPILSTIGVRTLLRFGGEIAILDERFIAELKARERDGVVVAPDKRYQPGQRVKINGGPFDGVVATILSIREKDSLILLMDLLQNSVRATVDQFRVLPAGPI